MVELPEIEAGEFARRLVRVSGAALSPATLHALFEHYEELRRWSPTLALIGPGAAQELFERHYAESLAAHPLLPAIPSTVVDIGSGAGFPGLVLAALRPDFEVTLTESRERKWAFLAAASRRARLSCRCLNVRVSPSSSAQLPDQIAIVTARAVRVDAGAWAALMPRLAAGAQALIWCGEGLEPPPAPFREERSLRLPGERRWIRQYRWPESR